MIPFRNPRTSNMNFLYLACPYSHPDAAVMRQRADMITQIAASIMSMGTAAVYSPITHGAAVEPFLPEHLRRNHDFWMTMDIPFVRHSVGLVLAPFEGWEDSKGVAIEIQVARAINLPLFMWQGAGCLVYDPAALHDQGWHVLATPPATPKEGMH